MLNVALIGVGGFGYCHMLALDKLQAEGRIRLLAVCDKNTVSKDIFLKRQVAFYENYQEMLDSNLPLDYVAISTPIHTHSELASACLQKGYHVLLEKPPAILPEEFLGLLYAKKSSDKLLAINYSMTSDAAFRKLLYRIRLGKLGKISRITGWGLYQRSHSYYKNSPWMGKLEFNGYTLRDGTINNPFSHVLNNLLLAARIADGGKVRKVKAELYSTYPITGEDTSCLRIDMQSGLEVFLFATLCSKERVSAQIEVKGSLGSLTWQYPGILRSTSGEESFPVVENATDSIHKNLCDAIENGADLFAPIESCAQTVAVADAAFRSSTQIVRIPVEFKEEIGQGEFAGIALKGIEKTIEKAVLESKLYSELGLAWAVPSKVVEL